MIIAIDHGNRSIKTVHTDFVSGLAKFSVEPPLARDQIWYNGMYYALTNERVEYRRDKTEDDDFYMLTLFAIAKEVEQIHAYDPYLDIQLSVGLPPEYFGALQDSFARYLLKDRVPVNFIYKNKEGEKEFDVTVTQVYLWPQAYAAITNRYEEIKQHDLYIVVDIGGSTSDCLLLRNGEIDMSYVHSPETGVIKLYNKAQRLIDSKYGMHVMEEQIDAVLQKKETFLDEEIRKIIYDVAQEHTENMLYEFKQNGFDLQALPVIFVGGGALLLRPFIEKSKRVHPSAQFVEDIRANAKGYDKLAKMAQAQSTGMEQ